MVTRGALSPAEVGEWLGFDTSTVYRLQKCGVIPFTVVGKSRRTAVSALEALVSSSRLGQDVGEGVPTVNTSSSARPGES